MGFFKKNKAKMGSRTGRSRSEYIRPGKYLMQVKQCKFKEATEHGQQSWYIAELIVLKSEETDPDIKPNKVGSEPAFMVGFPGRFKDQSEEELKSFLIAAYNSASTAAGDGEIDPDDIDDDVCDASYGEKQPLAGALLEVKAFNKKTKKDNDFTVISFSVPDDIDELLEEHAA